MKAVAALAPHLPGRLLPEALALMQTIDDADARRDALVGMLPHLNPSRCADALASVRRETDTLNRARLLSVVSSSVSDPQRCDLQREALGPASTHSVPAGSRSTSLTTGRSLTAEGVALMVSSLSTIDPIWRSDAKLFTLLSQNLPRNCLSELLDGIGSPHPDEGTVHFQETALIEIADYLPPGHLLDALEIATRIGAHSAFAHLVSRLPSDLGRADAGRTLRRAREIRITGGRAIALAALVRSFPEPERRTLFNEAIIVGRTLSLDNDEPEGTLAEMLAVLPGDLTLEVFTILVREMHDRSSIRLFAKLLNRVPHNQVPDTLALFLDSPFSIYTWPGTDADRLWLTLAHRLPPLTSS